MSETATQITKLRLKEISGVDDPANEAPGWLVLKGKEAVEQFENDIVKAHDSLTSESLALYLDEAPEEVKLARELLEKHIGNDLEEVEVEEEPEAEAKPETSAVSKLKAAIFGTEEVEKAEEAEEPEAEVEEEPEEEPKAEEAEEPEAEVEEEPEEEPKAEETEEEPEAEVEKSETPEVEDIAKEIGGVLREELEPMREALGSMIERVEKLEKASAKRASIDPDEEFIQKEAPTLGDAFRAASRGRAVTLS